MPPRRTAWMFTAGEKKTVSKSLARDLATGELFDEAAVATITVHQYNRHSGLWTDVTADFTIHAVAVNDANITREDGGTTLALTGVIATITASETEGSYTARVSAPAPDGTRPTSEVPLKVTGPAAP